MDYIVKKYLEECIVKFSKYGFKRKKNAFVRVKNDVMQNFVLEKTMLGWSCRVEFAVIPLCLRIEKDYVFGGVYSHDLKRFEPVPFIQPDPWEFNPKSEESMDECIKRIIEQIYKHLIPFFENADSCKNAYKELCDLDRKIYTKSEYSRANDRKYFHDYVNMLDYCKYWIALKNRDYDSSVKHLKAFEQQHLDSYEAMMKGGYLTDEDKIRREKSIEDLRRKISNVSLHNETYISQIISENESFSLENLKGIV